MSTIIFFRGFNTYPTEDLRFGPLNFGLAHKHLEPKFIQSGFNFLATPDIGRGEIDEQIENAYRYLLDQSQKNKISGPLHLLGHSAGGVVARGFAHKLTEFAIPNLSIKSVTSITSPHRGSQLAEMALDNKLQNQTWKKILGFSGYNIGERAQNFAPWTPAKMKIYNEAIMDLPQIAYASIISGSTLDKLPLAFQLLHKTHFGPAQHTDGIVELASQAWGKTLGQYELDHGAVLGMRTTILGKKYQQNRQQFENMVEKIISHLKSIE